MTERARGIALLLCFVLLSCCAGNGWALMQSPHENQDLDCQLCHTTGEWNQLRDPVSYSHESWPLLGMHRGLDCRQCHESLVFSDVEDACSACHIDMHDGALGEDCARCHTESGWLDFQQMRLQHESTGFPLRGRHARLNCRTCHTTQQWRSLSTDCIGCHREEYLQTVAPEHEAATFAVDCESCHSQKAEDWHSQIRWAHTEAFPLEGAHRVEDCTSCHGGGSSFLLATAQQCGICHEEDAAAVSDPVHGDPPLGLYTDCVVCHSGDTWGIAGFDHSLTGYDLRGAHTDLDCSLCHVDSYTGTSPECWSCHEDDYNETADPDHVANAFSTICSECHGVGHWSPAEFDHALTEFPLTGAHTDLECALCHVDGYTGTSPECWSCHEDDYNEATDPDHVANAFSTICSECHGVGHWSPAEFDHALTEFPLTGAHTDLECALCHVDSYTGTSPECWSCHEDDYNEAADPDHVANAFSTICSECHGVGHWSPAEFDHALTEFPLTGAHTDLECALCHVDGYTGTLPECWSCHEDDYNEAADPDHVANAFSTICSECHGVGHWSPAEFDHALTEFPLTGAHTDLECALCHVDGQFAGTPSDCFFCHAEDYEEAEDPDHAGAGFPTSCAQCHATTDWEDASFNHDSAYFRIYSGEHRNEWDSCSDCHTDSNDYSVFSCIDCHEHRQSVMDNRHHNVPGYVYESSACYDCHQHVRSALPIMRLPDPHLRRGADR